MKPYENVISELFEKHKILPKVEKPSNDSSLRKAGDDFMKNTLQIDMAQSKNIAPVERMQLLLKYMEQLQEYGSRVLTSGRADMIKIYHNAIDNVRKDLDQCRKDIEKEQKDKENAVLVKTKESVQTTSTSKSSAARKQTPPRIRSKSPAKKGHGVLRRSVTPTKKKHGTLRRSASPRRRVRSKSPRRPDRTRRSPSPRRRPRSPPRRVRSKSPRRLNYTSPPRRVRSPFRSSPPRRRSPQPSSSFSKKSDADAYISIFKDQLKRYMDILRRLRIEIEDTPIERRALLRDRMLTLRGQWFNFKVKVKENPSELGEFQYTLDICREELLKQDLLISGESSGPNDIPYSPPYPMPIPHPILAAYIPPPSDMYPPQRFRYPY